MTPNDTERPSAVTAAGPMHAEPAPDVADLLKKAETDVADLKDAWLRAKAETDNARKQGQADVARAHKYAIERFAVDLLPVKDALEQALATAGAAPDALRAGVELTLKQLSAAFEKAQISRDCRRRREVRSAPPPGDDDGRCGCAGATPSCRYSRKATC